MIELNLVLIAFLSAAMSSPHPFNCKTLNNITMKILLVSVVIALSLCANSQKVYRPYGRGISSAIGEDGTKSFIYRDPTGLGMAAWCGGELRLYGDTLAVFNSLMEYTMNAFNRLSRRIVVVHGKDTTTYHRYQTDTIYIKPIIYVDPVER